MVSAKGLWPTLVVILSCGLSACESSLDPKELVTVLPPPSASQDAVIEEYRISPNDKLTVTVFPDRNYGIGGIRVDALGNIVLPGAGGLNVKGLTAREAVSVIETRLRDCCLVKPQAIVQVDETTSQQIMIWGAVAAPEVYNLRAGRTTLLGAIAMAKGPDRGTANMKNVAIIRIVDGKRLMATFDANAIRDGKVEDPQIYGGDQIFVDSSRAKTVFRGAVQAIPFIGLLPGL